jgi:tetratricopeptide (TPR) repeat protein
MNESPLGARLGAAGALIDAGDFAGARELLAETTMVHPTAAEAWKELGVAENKLGNYDAAERNLLKSLELDSSDDDAWSSLGGLYFVLSRYEDALRCFQRGMDSDSSSTFSLVNYLTVAIIVGDTSALERHGPALIDGERQCAAQIDQDSNIPWCYFDLGQILFFEGRDDDARSAIRAGLVRSNDWQAESARLAYERLVETDRFAEPARRMLLEFSRYDRDRHHLSGDDGSPAAG